MAATLIVGRSFAPSISSVNTLTTELSSLQPNTTASTITPGTVLSGVIKAPGVGSVNTLTTELFSLQTNTTLPGLYPGTILFGVMQRPSVSSVQRLSAFGLTSDETIVLGTGTATAVTTQSWYIG